MKKSTKFLLFGLTLFTMSNYLSANNFFPTLTPQEVQKIFDDADNSGNTSYLINTSSKKVPAVQILPISDSPRTTIAPGTQCIKLYNCNQGICLVGLEQNKYATNEQLLFGATSEQKDINACNVSNNTADSKPLTQNTLEVEAVKPQKIDTEKTPPKEEKIIKPSIKPDFSWVKVIKVKQDDTLNIRKEKSYKSEKLGSVLYNSTCIKRFRCDGKWCEIQDNNTKGWVHRGFIEKMDSTSTAACL